MTKINRGACNDLWSAPINENNKYEAQRVIIMECRTYCEILNCPYSSCYLNRAAMHSSVNHDFCWSPIAFVIFSWHESSQFCMYFTVLDGDLLDIVLSLCNVHYSEVVCIAALQLIKVVSTNSQVCDAIVDNTRRNSVAKLLSMTSSTNERVCVPYDWL